MTFSDRLRLLMQQHEYKQSELADIISVSQQTISRWVTGKFQPDIGQLIALSKVFDVSVDYLLGRSNMPTPLKEQPTVEDDGLLAKTISRVQSLSDPALQRVQDFLDGLEAGQALYSAPPAAHGSAAGSGQ